MKEMEEIKKGDYVIILPSAGYIGSSKYNKPYKVQRTSFENDKPCGPYLINGLMYSDSEIKKVSEEEYPEYFI